ncbi:MAG: phosphoglycerate dehydrogenase [Candidatus Omnitrophica bacterium]|nr:phosphoglycerate dehydrogenase [Candidatus Omnitrophota bacterium]
MPTLAEQGEKSRVTQETFNVFVSDKLDASGLRFLEQTNGIRVSNKPGLKGQELKDAIRGADAIIIRSETKVTREVIEAAVRLKIIGRAGVGVDNVDLEAATKRGIIVMNTPEGNTKSTAELTWSMILALSRKVPQAFVSLRQGEWKRSQFTGAELYRKAIGIIGFGRIGREVARFAAAFGMKVVVYDPFISAESVKQVNVTFAPLNDLLKQADYVTVHTPLTPETTNLIGKEQFALMKKGVRIVNCARGGIVNEEALLSALNEGRVAGAALDVFIEEPPKKDNPLLQHPAVIGTPHLGAATVEAQENVSLEVAEQVVDALFGKEIRNSVNIPSLDAESARVLRPWAVLTEKLGLLQAQLFEGDVKRVEIRYSGEVTAYKMAPLTAAFLKGLLSPMCGESVNFINAIPTARERGITIDESTTTATEDFANAVAVHVTTSSGTYFVMGTLFGNKEARIVRIGDYDMDAIPHGTVLAVTNDDKPGFIGEIGTILGKNGVNIAEMTLGRRQEGKTAFAMINVDGNVPAKVLEEIRTLKKVQAVKIVRF